MKKLFLIAVVFMAAFMLTSCKKSKDNSTSPSQNNNSGGSGGTGISTEQYIRATVQLPSGTSTFNYTGNGVIVAFSASNGVISIQSPTATFPQMQLDIHTDKNSIPSLVTGNFSLHGGTGSLVAYYRTTSESWNSSDAANPTDKITITEIQDAVPDKSKRYIKGTFSCRVADPSLSTFGNITSGEFRVLVQ